VTRCRRQEATEFGEQFPERKHHEKFYFNNSHPSRLRVEFGSAQAGPCTADLTEFEATIRQSDEDPDAGLITRLRGQPRRRAADALRGTVIRQVD
jgi:hypothetical protein